MFKKLSILLITATLISACAKGVNVEPVDSRTPAQKQKDEHGSFFGIGNLVGKDQSKQLKNNQIKVNADLWRASLDVLSKQPLEKIETKSGTLQTEWVSVGNDGTEQIKISAIVLSADLNVSGVRVNVYKRKKQGGNWVNVAVSPQTVSAISDNILKRAYELYLSDNKK